jgi:ubiquinone/menaquinone biosynthesis C-methylase UbiE
MPLRVQGESLPPKADNLHVYRNPEVVSHYASLDYLTACERHLFDTYLTPGMAILDLGVGGGRTSAYLSQKASRYVGLDYSEAMIGFCRQKFPQLEFLVADASDLSKFADGSFDAVVFSFNGIDYVLPAEKRQQCLRECERVLRSGGVLIFSSHNPRAVLQRPTWDPRILHGMVRRVFPESDVAFRVALGVLTAAKAVHASLRAFAGSVLRMFRRAFTIAFWRGDGCLIDSAHGGLATHYWTPQHAIAETSKSGLRLETMLGDEYPKHSHEFVTDWYYYVFSKMASTAERSCA